MRFWIGFLVLPFCGISGIAAGSSSTTDTSTAYTTVTTETDAKSTSGTFTTVSKDSSTSGITPTQASTTITDVKPTGDSTVSGLTENPATLQSTTPIEPTTQPFVVTTVTWPIPLSETDPTTLLQAIARLNYSVTSLKKDLTDLYNNLNLDGNNNYITQLEDLNNTIIELQQNTTNLEADIDKANAIYTATSLYAQPLVDIVSCFKNSFCTNPPKPSPSMCPQSLLLASKTVQKFTYSSSLDYNCATTLQSNDGNPIVYTLNLTLAGSAKLDVFDPSTQKIVKNYTTNVTNMAEELGLLELIFQYRQVKSGDQISLNVDYNTKDQCAGINCNDHGNCVVVDGKPICNCLACHNGDDCSAVKDPCVGSQVERKCRKYDGKCVPAESQDSCTWTCVCPNGKQVDPQTCSTTIGDSMLLDGARKWLSWKN